MAITTEKIYAAQFIRCGSTFTRELISELYDFNGIINSHFFADKIYKNQKSFCTCRYPEEWYFSQWNYGKQRQRGDIFRLINSRLFRLKHLKRSWNNKTLSKFKIIIGIFLTIRNPESYYEDTTNSFFRFIKLVNSKKFQFIMGEKSYSHNQGHMFTWLCLSSFSNKNNIIDDKDPNNFFYKNSSIDNYIYLHGLKDKLMEILIEAGYTKEQINKSFSKITPNENRTKDSHNIQKYLSEDIMIFLSEKESFIYKLCDDVKPSLLK